MKKIMFLVDRHKLFIKYSVVGGIAAVIDFGVLYVLTDFLGVYYLISATISFILSALTNYFLNRTWTFRSRGRKMRQIPIFFTIATIGLILNNFILYWGVEFLGLWYIFSKMIATGIVLIWNFLGNKHFTFNDKKNRQRN